MARFKHASRCHRLRRSHWHKRCACFRCSIDAMNTARALPSSAGLHQALEKLAVVVGRNVLLANPWKTCEERSNAFGKDLLLQLPSLIPCHIRDRSEWHDRLRSHIYDHLVARSRNSGLQPLLTDRTCVDESMSGHAAPARCLKLLPKFRNLVALQASSSRLRQLSIVATCRLR